MVARTLYREDDSKSTLRFDSFWNYTFFCTLYGMLNSDSEWRGNIGMLINKVNVIVLDIIK